MTVKKKRKRKIPYSNKESFVLFRVFSIVNFSICFSAERREGPGEVESRVGV